ncbi:MAG: cytochrome P450 [Deltaproteobacteria bacterium]|nr:cytochrome P450 [Deltaproteobacteria bacterium]
MQPQSVLKVDEIDLSDLDFWVRPEEEREGAFQTLRRERPMSFYAEPEMEVEGFPPGPGYWAVTRHADILEASRNPQIFCSGKGATGIGDLPEEFLQFFGSFINMDDPDHMRLRKIVNSGFTPRMLAGMEEHVTGTAIDVIESVIDRGECDFVTELSAVFPIRIICDMMGIPRSQHEFVFERTNTILGAGDPDYIKDQANIAAVLLGAGMELSELMKEMRRDRLANPTDDLTSTLVHAEIDGERLTESEMASFFILLVAAGNETTRNAISHGMKALCDYPEQREIWQADFEGVSRSAVEEIVRWGSPVIFMRRTTTQACELGGQKLDENEKLILFYNSGNRDEDVWDNPFDFDLRRWPNEHVGFGGPGPHFCLGANLARREIKVFFRELFARIPDLEISGPPERLASNFIHGIKRMPCTFTPGGARAS